MKKILLSAVAGLAAMSAVSTMTVSDAEAKRGGHGFRSHGGGHHFRHHGHRHHYRHYGFRHYGTYCTGHWVWSYRLHRHVCVWY